MEAKGLFEGFDGEFCAAGFDGALAVRLTLPYQSRALFPDVQPRRALPAPFPPFVHVLKKSSLIFSDIYSKYGFQVQGGVVITPCNFWGLTFCRNYVLSDLKIENSLNFYQILELKVL